MDIIPVQNIGYKHLQAQKLLLYKIFCQNATGISLELFGTTNLKTDNNKKLLSEQRNKKMYIFTLFVYTHTEPREQQKAELPRHVVPHEAENLAS